LVFSKDSIGRYKNQIANLALIIFMVIVSMHLYQGKAKEIASLISRSDATAKKNALLEEIKESQLRMNGLRDFINNKDLSAVLTTLSNLATASGVKIDTVRPGPSVDLSLYVKYPFELTLKAKNYHAIGKFIGQLENSREIFIIDSLTLAFQSQPSEENGDDYLTAAVRVSTVVFKNK
jgi:Tfp pilus assembly protein PilO